MVQIKKKVTIKQKKEQILNPENQQETNSVQTQSIVKEKDNRSFKIIGILACLLCFFGLIYFFSDRENPSQEVAIAETVQAPTIADNSTTIESPKKEDIVAEDSQNIGNKSEQTKVSSVVNNNDIEKITEKPEKNLTPIEQTANRVLLGEFGNGKVRKRKLGKSYREVQNKVNEMYRNGLVH